MSERVGHVVLIGMMGSGKTTIGAAVAERLGRPFLDSDWQVEMHTGRTVRQIFESDGEAAFRRLESEALLEALSGRDPAVIAAAGGVVLDAGNRVALASAGTVVHLMAAPEILAQRVGTDDHRPMLGDQPEVVLRRLEAERGGIYAALADIVIDVGNSGVDEIVDEIVGELVGAQP